MDICCHGNGSGSRRIYKGGCGDGQGSGYPEEECEGIETKIPGASEKAKSEHKSEHTESVPAMKFLSREKEKFLEKLLFHLPDLEKAVEDSRSRKEKEAERSEDPTARFAILGLSVENMEIWAQILREARNEIRMKDSLMYAVMVHRYDFKERPDETCARQFISLSTYWRWRKDLLLVIWWKALEKKLKF